MYDATLALPAVKTIRNIGDKGMIAATHLRVTFEDGTEVDVNVNGLGILFADRFSHTFFNDRPDVTNAPDHKRLGEGTWLVDAEWVSDLSWSYREIRVLAALRALALTVA